jgi:hypothetical protein
VCSGFRKRSCSNKKVEWDDDSGKNHLVLAIELAARPHSRRAFIARNISVRQARNLILP